MCKKSKSNIAQPFFSKKRHHVPAVHDISELEKVKERWRRLYSARRRSKAMISPSISFVQIVIWEQRDIQWYRTARKKKAKNASSSTKRKRSG